MLFLPRDGGTRLLDGRFVPLPRLARGTSDGAKPTGAATCRNLIRSFESRVLSSKLSLKPVLETIPEAFAAAAQSGPAWRLHAAAIDQQANTGGMNLVVDHF